MIAELLFFGALEQAVVVMGKNMIRGAYEASLLYSGRSLLSEKQSSSVC